MQFDAAVRARAAGWHMLVSLLVAALAATLVFWLWYPGDFRLLAGGRDLFLLVVGVDVALGPLLTFAVFDLRKGWPHLRRDLAIIGLVQLAALGYGMNTVYKVRPVALVFEVDRFRLVTANAVYAEELPKALPEYRSLPLTGPWWLSARPAESREERNEALFMAVDGVDTGQRPLFWRPYAQAKAQALAKSRPVSVLMTRYPEQRDAILDKLKEHALDPQTARFLPTLARGDWVALIDPAGEVRGHVPLDGFF